jgi:hypothetical protein
MNANEIAHKAIIEGNPIVTDIDVSHFVHAVAKRAAELGIAEGRRQLAEELIQLYSCLNLNSETKRTSLRCFLLETASRPNRKGGDLK